MWKYWYKSIEHIFEDYGGYMFSPGQTAMLFNNGPPLGWALPNNYMGC